jgi:hypothetical protein
VSPTGAVCYSDGIWNVYRRVKRALLYQNAQLTLKIRVPCLVTINEQANWRIVRADWCGKVQNRGLILAVEVFELARRKGPEIDVLEHS